MTQTKALTPKENGHVPSLLEMSISPEIAKSMDVFNAYLHQDPPASFVEERNGVQYMPIDKVEFLLTKIFQQWYPEVIREGHLFNSVYVTVRVHYLHPVTGEWLFVDGVGAQGVQTDKGAAASDMGAIKHDAIMKALPSAKSYAIKDACDHIGRIFGKDLNRRETIQFNLERSSYANIFEQ